MATEIKDDMDRNEDKFYMDAIHYWSEVPATVDGMLGGFGFISQTDIKGSRMFLRQLFTSKSPPGRDYAIDCGAGIGRISKHLLAGFFEKVDLVEQNPDFLEQARHYIGLKYQNKIGNYYSTGLQNFKPDDGKYDIIWIQWVLGHLTDEDLVSFLKSCMSGLKPNGMIIIKENVTSTEEQESDDVDSSVTRPLGTFKKIFTKAGLSCYRQAKQQHFPKGLYTVFMFALKPEPKLFQDILSNPVKEGNSVNEGNCETKSDNNVANQTSPDENLYF